MRRRNLTVVVGGQYGSEGKGAVAGYLSSQSPDLVAVRVAGPNAGHSAVDKDGRKWALRCLPVAAVTNPNARLVIAAGSEIDADVLKQEINELALGGHEVRSRLFIDAQATRIEHQHKERETALVESIGSTGKGIGAARSDRVMRKAQLWGGDFCASEYLAERSDVLVEAAQGYGLGLHAGDYPQCTSSDCSAIDALSMAGVSPWGFETMTVFVVVRTFPIRVAGNSGPLLDETNWTDLHEASGGHIKTEYTTVTKKERRVASFNPSQVKRAIRANGGPDRGGLAAGASVKVALTFLDYLVPQAYEVSGPSLAKIKGVDETVKKIEEAIDHDVSLVGTGEASLTWREDTRP